MCKNITIHDQICEPRHITFDLFSPEMRSIRGNKPWAKLCYSPFHVAASMKHTVTHSFYFSFVLFSCVLHCILEGDEHCCCFIVIAFHMRQDRRWTMIYVHESMVGLSLTPFIFFPFMPLFSLLYYFVSITDTIRWIVELVEAYISQLPLLEFNTSRPQYFLFFLIFLLFVVFWYFVWIK